jgi:hypothetical protein
LSNYNPEGRQVKGDNREGPLMIAIHLFREIECCKLAVVLFTALSYAFAAWIANGDIKPGFFGFASE